MGLSNPFKPKPAPPAFGNGKTVPEEQASFLSKIFFFWVSPFLDVGYSRTLQKEDFWQLPTSRQAATITENLQLNFYARCPPENQPSFLREELAHKTSQSALTQPAKEPASRGSSTDDEKSPKSSLPKVQKESDAWAFLLGPRWAPKQDLSLVKAINRTYFVPIWLSGLLKLLAEMINTTAPLVNKVLLNWLVNSYVYHHLPDEVKAARAAAGIKPPQGIGYGIGIAVGLFVMQETASLLNNQFMMMATATGLSIRSAVIGAIFRKSVRLSGRSRLDHPSGKITTMISADTQRLDRFSAFGHLAWVAPIQLLVAIGLLIGNLGYSALVGVGVLILGFPLQFIFVKAMTDQSKRAIHVSDLRIGSITEILQGIRLIKYFAWEEFYGSKVGDIRRPEVKALRKLSTYRAILISIVIGSPVLAAVLSFITYALSGHELNIAIIFTSLQFFNIIRIPLMFFPMVLAALADSIVAFRRVSKFLIAEELGDQYSIDEERKMAIEIKGDFTWEAGGGEDKDAVQARKAVEGGTKKQVKSKKQKKSKADSDVLPTQAPQKDSDQNSSESEDEKPFELKDLDVSIPKGSFVAIVGSVGSGKSSILQAVIGEMRKTKGEVFLGSDIAYVPQAPWIKNSSLTENILFGRELDEQRFHEVIRACSLEHDLEVLPHAERTEIGEKGINLSGGQKARVSLARAVYSKADTVLLDDPLSAVDAHVGKDIVDNCLLSGPLANRTRVLVTHALHVLDKTDYIYVVDHGRIIEHGTYTSLLKDGAAFARLMEEYGSSETANTDTTAQGTEKEETVAEEDVNEDGQKKGAALMQEEERFTGAVALPTYKEYLKHAGGLVWAPVIVLFLLIGQGFQAGTFVFLGLWTSGSIPNFSQRQYMGVYTALGVGQAIMAFFLTFSIAMVALTASNNIFLSAFKSVLRAPVSFFDTTPMGRVLSRLSKDQDTVDREMVMSFTQVLMTISIVGGTVGLVFYVFPLLGIIFAPLLIIYGFVSTYYRSTSIESKRMDSVLRSVLYASYSEALTGLSTIRAFREQAHYIKNTEHGLDLENRAYYMTIVVQRWLGVRLDLLGNTLLFGISLFAAGFRFSVHPSKVGVLLSYSAAISQTLSDMVTQFALNEQNMNAVERLLVYSHLPSEAPPRTSHDPPPTWPPKGGITFSGVKMRYREHLPLVLKDVSFKVNPGEKVGVVGRTGAGKSSLLQVLFRIVELADGKIEIDGQDISLLGLDTLRERIALVPQDSILFKGTLRQNLDPQASRTDAELIEVLQKAWLLPKHGKIDPLTEAKFSLDAKVGDEASNYSAGEKQLIALCRALVKNSKIIILDEATSSVDVETDAKLQRTFQTEFASSTLLCIAHRLNTIAYYDRILVMEGGEIAEFDTVLNLYDKEDSIFRSLCEEANLGRADIVKIREAHRQVASRSES